MTTLIIAIGLLYFVGHLLTHFFDKSKVPDVLILIIFGILMGPVFGLITPESIGKTGELFTSIALIIILFEGGLDIEINNLLRSAKQAMLLTVTFFFVSAAIIFSIMHYGYDYSTTASLVTGFICGGTSSAVVIPMVSLLKTGKEAATILVLESALTDVLCIVFALGVLESIDHGEVAVGHIIGQVIASLVIASVVGLIGGCAWLYIINKIRRWQNTQFATFAFMFIVYGIAEMLGYSGAIASLAFGIVMGNNREISKGMKQVVGNMEVGLITNAEKTLYKEIVFLLKIFFFIYLGISIPITQTDIILIALSIVLAIYTARPFVTRFLVTRRVDAYDRTIIGAMVPKGLAAAVLAGLPIKYNMIEGSNIQAITYNIVLISIIFTSVFIPLLELTPFGKFMRRFMKINNTSKDENGRGAIDQYGDPLKRI